MWVYNERKEGLTSNVPVVNGICIEITGHNSKMAIDEIDFDEFLFFYFGKVLA